MTGAQAVDKRGTNCKKPAGTCVRCGKPIARADLRRCTPCLGKPLRPSSWERRPYHHVEGE